MWKPAESHTAVFPKNGVDTLTAQHPGKPFPQIQSGQRVSPSHGKLDLFNMLQAQTFPANNAYTHGFTVFTLFKAIVTFKHIITSTDLVKKAVFLQGLMAGNAHNPFNMFKIGF
jgi:hypothetical protein